MSLWRIDGCNILFTNFYLKNKVIIHIYRLHTIGTDRYVSLIHTAWKVSKYGVISRQYLLRKSPYSVRIQENTDQK